MVRVILLGREAGHVLTVRIALTIVRSRACAATVADTVASTIALS